MTEENNEPVKYACPHITKCEHPTEMPCYKAGHRILRNIWKWWEIEPFIIEECSELDYSNLTVKEMIEKIKEFLGEKHEDIDYEVFLRLLAFYPVSMCKRDVSPRLKQTIGLLYHSTQNQTNPEKADAKYSFDDLARLFARSKATIKVCVDDSLPIWYQIKRDIALEKLHEEENNQNKQAEQPNERTNNFPYGEE